MELALFATDVSTLDRIEIDQILKDSPPNFNQANRTDNFMISLALNILKQNFQWKCIAPIGPVRNALCTNWELLLNT